MKFVRNFLQFQKKILEQTTSGDEIIGGKTEFEVKASPAGKKKLKLDYTTRATDPIWQGENYEKTWKPAVDGALDNPETYQKILNYLKTYNGQDADTVKKILQREEKAEKAGKGSVRFALQKLATDGKIGPFHTIMRKAVEKATGKEIQPLEIKSGKIVTETIPETKPNLQKVEVQEQKPVEEKPVEEKPKPQERKFEGPKAETSDPATGTMGEKEKQEIRWDISGKDSADRILNMKYPLTQTKKSQLGNYVVRGDFKVGQENEISVKLKDIGQDRFIYFLNNYIGDSEYPIEVHSLKMPEGVDEIELKVTPRNEGQLTIKMIVSTVNFRPKYKIVDVEGQSMKLMRQTDCQKFLSQLESAIKPFSDTKWDGPVFSATTRTYGVSK